MSIDECVRFCLNKAKDTTQNKESDIYLELCEKLLQLKQKDSYWGSYNITTQHYPPEINLCKDEVKREGGY